VINYTYNVFNENIPINFIKYFMTNFIIYYLIITLKIFTGYNIMILFRFNFVENYLIRSFKHTIILNY